MTTTLPSPSEILDELKAELGFSKSVYGRKLRDGEIDQARYDQRLAVLNEIIRHYRIQAEGPDLFEADASFRFSDWLKSEGFTYKLLPHAQHQFTMKLRRRVRVYAVKTGGFYFDCHFLSRPGVPSLSGVPVPKNEAMARHLLIL